MQRLKETAEEISTITGKVADLNSKMGEMKSCINGLISWKEHLEEIRLLPSTPEIPKLVSRIEALEGQMASAKERLDSLGKEIVKIAEITETTEKTKRVENVEVFNKARQ